jgi:G:T-mismatch repair DNA endonuclease (very short patch repair protein)
VIDHHLTWQVSAYSADPPRIVSTHPEVAVARMLVQTGLGVKAASDDRHGDPDRYFPLPSRK